ncbi:MAG: hypothetical protein HY908_02090 [Myxococcales bacterium]|nr:hypothetical protein [Myxococcales bacterium]
MSVPAVALTPALAAHAAVVRSASDLRRLLRRDARPIAVGGAAARLAAACDRGTSAVADLRRIAVRAAERSLRGAA